LRRRGRQPDAGSAGRGVIVSVLPADIRRDEVRRVLESGGQVVEVLPEQEYQEEHLPGAINLPLKKLGRQTAAVLDRDKPVAVYCHDRQ
jgi:rhodanese-related sulfurtransferase